MARLPYHKDGFVGWFSVPATLLLFVMLLDPMICLGVDRMKIETKVLVDFEGEREDERWKIVNDGVMGGLSQSGIEIKPASRAVFSGELSLKNNGGFASVRRLPHDYDLERYEGFLLRVKGDGRTYQLRVRTDERFDGIAYRAEFKTKANKWMTVDIPFPSFEPTFRGRSVPDVGELQSKRVRQIGFLIADKREGRFRVEIDWIQAYQNRDFNTEEDSPAGI